MIKTDQLRHLAMGLVACTFILFSKKSIGQSEPGATISDSQGYTSAHLVQTDSIMIDVIGQFRIYDYQPESGLFLAGDFKQLMSPMPGSFKGTGPLGLIVFNREGQVLHRFNQANDGPTGYGQGAYAHFFLGAEAIGVLGNKALFRYQLDGTFIDKNEQINTLGRRQFYDQIRAVSSDGINLAVGLLQPKGALPKTDDSIFQKVSPLWFYNLQKLSSDESSGTVSFQSYPEHPVYAPASKLPRSLVPPLMAVDIGKGRLYATHPEVPSLYVYDINKGTAQNAIDLRPDHFEFKTEMPHFSGATKMREELLWKMKGGHLVNSQYHDLIQLGDYTLLRYSSAIPETEVSKLMQGRSFGRHAEWPRIRRKHYKYYYQLFKEGKKVTADFLLPTLEPRERQFAFRSSFATNGIIIGGNGLDEIFVFIPNVGDEERDYELIRVYKLELTAE